MNIIVFALIILSVIFNTTAQIALKTGISRIGDFSFTFDNLIPITLKIIASPWIVFGMAVYVGSMAIWLMVLSRTPVSIAYPMVSLGYITSAIAAYYICGESLTITRIMGIIIILIGVYFVTKT